MSRPSRSSRAARREPVGELAVLEGGGWSGRWYPRAALEQSQAAAARIGHPVAVEGPGELRGYRSTEQWAENPDGHGAGRVWRWDPDQPGPDQARADRARTDEPGDGGRG